MTSHRELSASDLLGLGLSPRTAYLYARIWLRVETALEDAGVDWLSCTAGHIGVIASGWTLSHSARSQLRAAIGHAWEILERDNPPSLRAVRVPPKPQLRCKAIAEDDAGRLERAAWARHDAPGLAVLIGLYSGLRRAEIAQLRWDHLSVDKNGLPEWMSVMGKGAVAAEIPVHPVLARVLVEHRRPGGWVFPGRTGDGPVSPGTVWGWVRLVGDEAGVPVRTHLLRHTALAEANDRSGDLRAVQDLARHARPELTAGYTRTTSARLKAVTAMIDYGRNVA